MVDRSASATPDGASASAAPSPHPVGTRQESLLAGPIMCDRHCRSPDACSTTENGFVIVDTFPPIFEEFRTNRRLRSLICDHQSYLLRSFIDWRKNVAYFVAFSARSTRTRPRCAQDVAVGSGSATSGRVVDRIPTSGHTVLIGVTRSRSSQTTVEDTSTGSKARSYVPFAF
jgi:hypothetical protein